MFKDNAVFMDLNSIVILFRDVNGKRFHRVVENVEVFHSYDWSWYDDENYEILMVEWGRYCIYNALRDDAINLEDLIGFFA